jgi:hypothetical protein
VKLGYRFAVAGSSGFERLLQRHGVRARGIFLAAKCTQPTSRNTDVGGIDVAIDVEVSLVAMKALTNVIGQPPESKNVVRAIQRERGFGVEPLARSYFWRDGFQTRIVGYKRVSRGHCFDDIAPQQREEMSAAERRVMLRFRLPRK